MSNAVLNIENEPLIEKYSEPIKLVKLQDWNEVCCENELFNLLDILKEGNKTLDDITDEYKIKYEEKSKTSIHRYIKSYIEKGFIIESGRIIKGKQHTAEKTYTTAAKIFFIDNQYLDAWEQGERSLTLASKIGVIAQKLFNNRGFEFEPFKDLFKHYEMSIQNSAIEALKNAQSKHSEINDNINKLDNDEKLVFFAVLKNAFVYLTKGKLEGIKRELESIYTKDPLNISDLITESMKKEEKYQQLIISKPAGYQTNYTRKMVHFTDWEKYTKYMLDVTYNAIFIVLGANEYPLTIKTITEKFPIAYDFALEHYNCKLSTKNNEILEKSKKAKKDELSENRIYRLIQELKNDGLVIEAGRQISKDSSKTSILYTTTGKRTIYLENRDEFWKIESKWKKIVQLVGKILKYSLDISNLNEESFYDIFTKIEKLKFESYKEMLTDISNPEISNYYHQGLNGIELNSSISALGTINVFFQKEDIFTLTKKLQECFS